MFDILLFLQATLACQELNETTDTAPADMVLSYY